jgi:hypothetical protein
MGDWGGSQSRSGRHGEVKILDPTGNRTPNTPVVQPVASRYTDCAIPAPLLKCMLLYLIKVACELIMTFFSMAL